MRVHSHDQIIDIFPFLILMFWGKKSVRKKVLLSVDVRVFLCMPICLSCLHLYGLCLVCIMVDECKFKVDLTCLPLRRLGQLFASKI